MILGTSKHFLGRPVQFLGASSFLGMVKTLPGKAYAIPGDNNAPGKQVSHSQDPTALVQG
jgi:hypothetical protein